LAGLAVGSFVAAGLFRLPRGISLWRPRSFCPACRRTIPVYDLIPVLSYIVLRGRCRACGATLSPWYPAVEAAVATLSLLCAARFGPTPLYLFYFVFLAALLAAALSDARDYIIPDAVVLPATAAGLAGALAIGGVSRGEPSLLTSAVGALMGAVLFWGARWVYYRLRRREGLGLGDVKLMAMIGSFVGIQGLFPALLAGSAAGLVWSLGTLAARRRRLEDPLPYGVFLALGASLVALARGGW